LSLLPFFEWTTSSEASLWTDALPFSSFFELFARDQADRFFRFLVSLVIFSSCNLMCGFFSSLSLMGRSDMGFMAAISSYKLLVPIAMTGMTMVLEDSTLFFD